MSFIKGIAKINIYKEFYSHEDCDCWKFKNPFTHYAEEIVVLSRVKDETLSNARDEMIRWFLEDLEIKIKDGD